jgi:carbamate kinase
MTIVIALSGNALLRRGDRRPEGAWRRWSRSWF